MKHTQLLPYLGLVSLFAAACVVDVSGLATTPLPDAGSLAAQSDSNNATADAISPTGPAPANTYACGWEQTFFKPVKRTTGEGGNSLVRYDSFGRGSIIASDTATIKYIKVIAASSAYVVALVTGDVAGRAGLAIVSLATGEIKIHELLKAATRPEEHLDKVKYDVSGQLLYVTTFAPNAGVMLVEVNLANGAVFETGIANAMAFIDELPRHFRADGVYVSLIQRYNGNYYGFASAMHVGTGLDVPENIPVNSFEMRIPGRIFWGAAGANDASMYALGQIPTNSPGEALQLWHLAPVPTGTPRAVYTFPLGGSTAAPTMAVRRSDNAVLVANDRQIFKVDDRVGAVPTATQIYSYTPVFGGFQPVGISDLRVTSASNSGLATFVQPCGELNGNPLYGVRTLPNSADPGKWLWELEGFPTFAENRSLVSSAGYGYRIAYTEPESP